MKRCPQCNRVETDDALVYCRVDGTALINDSGVADAGSAEIETSILPHRTDADINRPTAPTTVLSESTSGTTRNLAKPKRRKTIMVVAIIAAVALGLAVVIVFASTLVYLNLKKPSPTAITSIAVLPLTNSTGDKDIDFLSEGISETLINNFTRIPELKVTARSTAFRYRGREGEPQVVGRELGVGSVLTGRLLQRGDTLSIQVDLINTSDGVQIWGNRYEGKSADIVSIQQRIATDVSQHLKLKLTGAQQQQVAKTYTQNPEAYQLYLKGRYHWNRRTGDSIKQAVEFYEQAIEKDPNYAQAYAGLASSYIYFPNYTIALPKDSMPQAKAAAMRALQLDDSLAEAYVVLGRYRAYFEWDRDGGEREVRRAIELDPNFAWAHTILAAIIAKQKRFDEAIAEAKRAEELEPLALSQATVGERFIEARRFDESIAQSKKLLRLDPNYPNTHWNLGWAYLGKGLYQESITSYQKYYELNDDPLTRGYMALAHAKLGHRDEAAKLLEWLKQESSRRYVPSFAFALTYIALGQKDEAFVWLEKDVTDRTGQASSYAVEPALDDVRDDPRFKAMLRRMNLPE